jgi:hypothetical protein
VFDIEHFFRIKRIYSPNMTEARVERGTCRFVASNNEQGKPIIRLELFHGTVSLLKNASLSFNLLGGVSLEQAKKIADSLNENVLDISVNMSSDQPMFSAK